MLCIKRRIENLRHENLGLCMVGNTGPRKQEVACHYARLLESLGVFAGSRLAATTGSRLMKEHLPHAKKIIDSIVNAGGGVLFVEDIGVLSHPHSPAGLKVLDSLLAQVHSRATRVVFAFAGYSSDMEKLVKLRPAPKGILPARNCMRS